MNEYVYRSIILNLAQELAERGPEGRRAVALHLGIEGETADRDGKDRADTAADAMRRAIEAEDCDDDDDDDADLMLLVPSFDDLIGRWLDEQLARFAKAAT